MKILGYLVIEHCEDYEQPLGLYFGKDVPKEGILTWTDGPRAVFEVRREARAAITRTDAYARAFGLKDLPEKKFCKVVPLTASKPKPKSKPKP